LISQSRGILIAALGERNPIKIDNPLGKSQLSTTMKLQGWRESHYQTLSMEVFPTSSKNQRICEQRNFILRMGTTLCAQGVCDD